MFQRLSSAVILSAALGCGVAQAATPPDISAVAQLVAQIHLGESLYRDDLVASALDRLYRIQPDHPEGLAAQVRLALRQQHPDKAQEFLAHLQRVAPNSDAYRQAATLVRLTVDQAAMDTLGQARLFSAAGRLDEARRLYDQVFQGVYPSADFALEYWRFRSREPNGDSLALPPIQQILAEYPQHVGLLTAAAQLSLALGRDAQGLDYLHRLAAIDAGRAAAADMEFNYLSGQAIGRHTTEAWGQYAVRYAGLPQADLARQQAGRQQALLDDPAWQAGRQGLALIQAEKNTSGALARLRQAVRAYPDDPAFLGALGLAWLRSGDRRQALHYFEQAKAHETQIGGSSAWVSLIDSTRYWLLLEQAGKASASQQWTQAESLYRQARALNPQDETALIDEADMNARRGRPEAALRGLLQALRMAPGSEGALRGIQRILMQMPPSEALAKLDTFPSPQARYWSAIRRDLRIADHARQAEQAQLAGDWAVAAHQWAAVQALNVDDPWASYRLAEALRQQGRPQAEVMQAYDRHLQRHRDNPVSRYAQALLLESVDQWQSARAALADIAATNWTPDMHALDERLQTNQRIADAQLLFDQGQQQAAIRSLEVPPLTLRTRLQLAQWAQDMGDLLKAQGQYAAILMDTPDQPDAVLGQLEIWGQQGHWDRVLRRLQALPSDLQQADAAQSRRLATLWQGVGQAGQARAVLQASAAQSRDPLVYRDLGRLDALDNAPSALDQYALAMQGLKLLPQESVGQSDPVALTRATRLRDDDDWRVRSVRSETAELYERRNPTLTVQEDTAFRRDGAPGVSRLWSGTSIARLDMPLGRGRAFIQADHVRLDAGTFDTDDTGSHTEWFGTCNMQGADAGGVTRSLPGCSGGLSQTAIGTGVALGYVDDRWAVDLGHSPFGFEVSNWLGGISYRGDLGQLGWRLSLSRRPMSNSLLSYAGTVDPRTGQAWGGVVATGPSLGLSWDQGGRDGVWADISHQRLTGKNVADNTRTRLMGGYYRRLINRVDTEFTLGLNAMYWTYQKDLSEYTLGQGGYYSPQRYFSLSLPVRYAHRTADWSYTIGGSVSRSWSRTADGTYYPLPGLLGSPLNTLAGQGVSAASVMAASQTTGSGGGGFGYQLQASAERRLNNHWVLGAALDLQKSQDYSPSRALIYLRYTFQPWQGNLPLPVSPITAYSEYK